MTRAVSSARWAKRYSRNAEALDLPFELDPARLLDPRAHRLAELLEIGAGGIPLVDEKVAVHLGDLGVADRKPAAAGRVDQLPGLLPGGFLKVEPPVRLLIGCTSSR